MAKMNDIVPLDSQKSFGNEAHKSENAFRVVFFGKCDKKNSQTVDHHSKTSFIFSLFSRPRKSYFISLDNRVTSARYNVWNFLPLQIMYQLFSKLANLYFLFISIIQQPNGWSSTGKYTTLGPLSLFVSLAILREAYDDFKRHQQDSVENNKKCRVLNFNRNPSLSKGVKPKNANINDTKMRIFSHDFLLESWDFTTKRWQALNVGDIVQLEADDLVPADLVIVKSSHKDGNFYVETSSLDGESNLKQKNALLCTQDLEMKDLINMRGCINTELPNNELYRFDGSIDIFKNEKGVVTHSININNLALRGSKLKNTEYVIGIVVFSGEDTKIRMNAMTEAYTKRPLIEKTTNRVVCFLFFLIILLASISTYFSIQWDVRNRGKHTYILDEFDIVRNFFSFVILYNSLIPISLYVMMEMIKLIQAYFISVDVDMFDESVNQPAEAKTSSLNEDLGQVSYIFSDKTGTLTENVMEFKKYSVVGTSFDYKPKCTISQIMEQYKSEKQPSLQGETIDSDTCIKTVSTFFRALALTHTALSFEENNNIKYQSSSPEEQAILNATKDYGIVFSKNSISCQLKISDDTSSKETYELLNVIEFTSARKRMSTIYRFPDSSIVILCKGADSEIQKRLSTNMTTEQQMFFKKSQEHLKKYASQGLRVLMYGMRILSEKEYERWSLRYDEANSSINNRQETVDAVSNEIEVDFSFLGIAAIEDKLQEGVPKTLEILIDAGIKVWVLTGDKKETAINVGYASNLLKQNTIIHNLEWSRERSEGYLSENIKDALNEMNSKQSFEKIHHAIVIDGDTLSNMSNHDSLVLSYHGKSPLSKSPFRLIDSFIDCASKADTVICCRVSPSQKAQIVKEMKNYTGGQKVTLAIGDGANDVAMIREAHVGIGIFGKEGMQASRSSDYAISKFRFLRKLLLVHGHWSYVRVSKFIMSSFYKCIAFFLSQALFQVYTGISGTSLYESWTLALYNIIFSSTTVFCIGIFEKDLNSEVLMNTPHIYKLGIHNRNFNWTVFFFWFLSAVFHAVCITMIPLALYGVLYDSTSEHMESSIYILGTIVYTGAIFVVNLKMLCIETFSWCWITILFTLAPCSFWFVFQWFYSELWNGGSIGYEIYGLFDHLFAKATYPLTVILVITLSILPELTIKSIKRIINPNDIMLIQEMKQKSAL